MSRNELTYYQTTGHVDAIKAEHSDRRFVILHIDDFKAATELREAWRRSHPAIAKLWILDEAPFYGQSGPPNIQAIRPSLVEMLEAEGPPIEGPDEIKAKAKARAVAIFGPKKGR